MSPRQSFTPDWAKWVAALSILGTLGTIAVQQGRIMQRQEDLERDIQRLEQALIMGHPETARALGFTQER